jgi:hypothetical protein
VANDTLLGIAARYNVDPVALASLNGITNPNAIYVGQILKIPSNVAAPTAIPAQPTQVAPTQAPVSPAAGFNDVNNPPFDSDHIVVDGLTWDKNRDDDQEPKNCAQTGMCNMSIDVASDGVTYVWGSPFKVLGKEYKNDASKRQAQVLVFINVDPNHRALSLTIEGWSAANAVQGFKINGAFPTAPQMNSLAAEAVRRGFWYLRVPGNCGSDGFTNPIDQGCHPDRISYAVYACTANDTCTLLYEVNRITGVNNPLPVANFVFPPAP